MVIVAASATATIHKMVRRLTTGRRCIVIRGGRVFIRAALHRPGEERRLGTAWQCLPAPLIVIWFWQVARHMRTE
jgi:hypothetical protein